jgi:hypothetical protein
MDRRIGWALAFAVLVGTPACGGGGPPTPPGTVTVDLPPPPPGTVPPPVTLPPATALRRTAGDLQTGRRDHRATLLSNGTVLVTGGFVQGTTMAKDAEIYDPATETFRAVDDEMHFARAGHVAVLLGDGRVLVAGGWWEPSIGVLSALDEAEVFDPATETFTPVGPMTTERVDHAAATLTDGRVLVTGGSRIVGSFLEDLDTAETFDPTTDTFTLHPELMTHTRATHGMIGQGNGKILLAGGSDSDLRAEWYDTVTDTFIPLSPAVGDEGRFGAAMARFSSGAVAVTGGDLLGTVLHVQTSGTVQNTGSGLSRSRAYHTATRIATDKILVAGGIDFSDNGFVVASCDLIAEGGTGGSRTYATPVRFQTGMAGHSATRLQSGKVLFCGGLNVVGGQPELAAAYLFSP